MKYIIIVLMVLSAAPAFAAEKKTTLADCKELAGYGDEGYCYMDLAEEEKSIAPCDFFHGWGPAKECIYYVDRARKIVADECNVLTDFKSECRQYVESGIPSKPGQSFEDSEQLR